MARDVRFTPTFKFHTKKLQAFPQAAGHGKSPCFSRCNVLKVAGVDYPLLVFACVNVGNFLECDSDM
jgi:hypothetical protein